MCCWPTTGPATSASCRTRSSAVILNDGGLITAAQLGITPTAARPAATTSAATATATHQREDSGALQALPEMEKQAVVEALKRSKGNKSQAATALGLSRTRFYTLLRRYGVD